jgi:hypothetical protein
MASTRRFADLRVIQENNQVPSSEIKKFAASGGEALFHPRCYRLKRRLGHPGFPNCLMILAAQTRCLIVGLKIPVGKIVYIDYF